MRRIADRLRALRSIALLIAAGAIAALAVENLPEPASAQITGFRSVPLGYQQATVDTATSLTVPTGATTAVITIEAQAARYRDDGTAPTATVGMPLAVAASITYTGNLGAIQFISQTAGSKINVSYYR